MSLKINQQNVYLLAVALSAGEKQRRYRQRRDADPQKRAAYLQKEKIKYAKDKEQDKKKVVANL